MADSAEECRRALAELGFDAKTVEAGGHPSVIARRAASRNPDTAPTVLLYAHHDIQPVADEDAWGSAPFEMTERDGRLYGRGIADDKGGLFVHIAALAAWGDDLPVNVVVLAEGEEEIGSPTLSALLDKYKDQLAADVLVIADSVNWAVDTPGLTTTLRGLVDVEVEVSTLRQTLHSGAYGGPVPDALTTLCALLGTLHDDTGAVAVEGLVSLDKAADVNIQESVFRADAGVLDSVTLTGSGTITERLWYRPSVTVTAISGPEPEDAPNSLAATARARISTRIAPSDTPERAFAALERHLKTHARFGAEVKVNRIVGAEASDIRVPEPIRTAVMSALEDGWGTPAVDMGVGGTLPLVQTFTDVYPSLVKLATAVQDPLAQAHSDDESMDIAGFEKSCLAEALLLGRLAQAIR